MATPTSHIQKLDQLYREMDLGASAGQVVKALDPIVEKRLGQLLDEFKSTPPELGALLDIRAKISEVWRIRRELTNAVKNGQAAMKALEAVIDVKSEAA